MKLSFSTVVLILSALFWSCCSADQCRFDINNRVDCWPDTNINPTKQKCESRKCCWDPNPRSNTDSVPYCFYPTNYPTYTLLKTLSKSKSSANLIFKKPVYSPWPNVVDQLSVSIEHVNPQVLRLKISDYDNKRFEVPVMLNTSSIGSNNSDFLFDVTSQQGQPFYVSIVRKSDKQCLFCTNNVSAPLLFSDQFLQISSWLQVPVVYGLGHRDKFAKLTNQWLRYAFWSHDAELNPGNNLYGVHNFLLALSDSGNAYGILFLNSNAHELSIQPQPAITYRSIGGILDFYLLIGPTPKNVIHQYHQLLGGSTMPSYWSLGFHLCRYGYNSSAKLESVYNRNVKAGIPMDTIWVDIDHMDNFHDFTYDKKAFSHLPAFIKSLHAEGRYFVPILDPAISSKKDPSYYAYVSGVARNVFIQFGGPSDDKFLVGGQWPGDVYFPDFTHPNTTQWWTENLALYRKDIEFDGLWIDMNEPSSFYQGSKIGCVKNSKLDNPPYTPRIYGGKLTSETICPSSKQYLSSHYNLHSLFGHFEGLATYHALTDKLLPNRRPFIVGRSTVPTSQNFVFHWTGDNEAKWEDMAYSISQILNYNIYGIIMVGADVCGFNSPTNEELCVRWTQLGAFYPFFRNHNDESAPDQDPAAFSPTAQTQIRNAILKRYSLLPYFYTYMFLASTPHNKYYIDKPTTLFRSMMEEFPTSHEVVLLDTQFFVGDALLVVPVLQPNVSSIKVFLPSHERWFVEENGLEVPVQETSIKIPVSMDSIPLFVRGGKIVLKQKPADRTAIARLNPFSILAALDYSGSAIGQLFWDAGDTVLDGDSDVDEYNYIRFQIHEQTLTSTILQHTYQTSMPIDFITVYGLSFKPTGVSVNGKAVHFQFDSSMKSLVVALENCDLQDELVVKWS